MFIAIRQHPARAGNDAGMRQPGSLKKAPRRFVMTDIVNNVAQHQFELVVDGHLATAHYEIKGNVVTFVHTEVPPELGGKGVGSKLVQGALDQVRASGMKVTAECPFVKGWIGKHPAYQDLLKS
jgi:predicted GNAT family acetyltransferase